MAESITPDMMLDWEEAWEVIDAENKGSISTQQLLQLFLNLGQADMTLPRVEKICSGYFQKDEFIAHMKKNVKGKPSVNEVQENLRMLGKDASDHVKSAELRFAMANMGQRLTEEEANELLVDADPQGSGYVDTWAFAQKLVDSDAQGAGQQQQQQQQQQQWGQQQGGYGQQGGYAQQQGGYGQQQQWGQQQQYGGY